MKTAREWMVKAAAQGEEAAIENLQQLDEIEERTIFFVGVTVVHVALKYD